MCKKKNVITHIEQHVNKLLFGVTILASDAIMTPTLQNIKRYIVLMIMIPFTLMIPNELCRNFCFHHLLITSFEIQ